MRSGSRIRKSKIATHPNRIFTLQPYNAEWSIQFKAKAVLLRKLLGSEMRAIEHVGSTSIPGMIAKPQIDILVIVDDLSRIKSYYQHMQAAGFTPRGDYTGEGEEYFTEDNEMGQRVTSIHVLPEGHVWAEDLINFRDYLRAHPTVSNKYAQAKQHAVAAHPNDYDAYYRNKLDVIQRVRQEAANWKAAKRTS